MAYSIAVTGEGGSNRVESAGNERILETFLSLKQDNSSYELKRIGSNYYVYLSSGRLDRNTGRMRKISIYRGRITPDGTFVPIKRKRNVVLNGPVHAVSGGSTPAETGAGTAAPAAEPRQAEKYEKSILTALSMNGRISMPVLSRMLGLSVNATIWQVRNVERKYEIKYLPEMDITKFGYIQFFVTVKFLGSIPPIEELRSVISGEPRAQFAMQTKGDFDLMIHILAKNIDEMDYIIMGLRSKLADYDSIWGTIPIHEAYSFIPLRDRFIDLLKERGELLNREYAVLKELLGDASINFSKIDEKYGFDPGRAAYSYYKLRSESKISRITINLRKPPVRYVGIILQNLINRAKFDANRKAFLLNIIEDEEAMPINKYVAVYDITNPNGSVLFKPISKCDELNKTVEDIEKLNLGVKLSTLIVSDMVIGDFCYRKSDNAYSIQQYVLEDKYGVQKADKMDYEDTGRNKAEERFAVDIRGARMPKETDTGFN
jgi:DNA-binding Lrp family transcriptional regulator